MPDENKTQLEALTEQLKRLLRGENAGIVECGANFEPALKGLCETVNRLIVSFNDAQDFIPSLAEGNLEVSSPPHNLLASRFKQLQSNLLHLAWQTGQIAAGDYSQRVHIMGSYSTSFNAMVETLEEKRRTEELLRESQAKQAESRQLLTDVFDFLPDATLIIDRFGVIMVWNLAMELLTGIKSEEMLGKGDYEYAIPFYGERRPILIDLALRPNAEFEKEYTSFQREGDTLFLGESFVPSLRSSAAYLSATASVLRDSRGEVVAAIECIRDETKRKETEDALRVSQNQLALAMELSRLVKWESDVATDMFTFNDQFYALYSTSAEREGGYLMPTDVYVRDFVHPDDIDLVYEMIGNNLAFQDPLVSVQFEHRIVRRDGEMRDIAVKITAIRDKSGKIIKFLGANQDITEHKRLEKMLSQLARTDQMTGVNNRGYFLELLDAEIERAGRYGSPLCMLMLDLDHFKLVNDNRGHAAGDEAIRTLTRVLQTSVLRKNDILGRMGGEEFAIALPETGLHDVFAVAERVRSLLAATLVNYACENFFITVSIGVSAYRDGDTQETLLQRADQAMYQAKQTGRNRVCLVS